MALKQYLIRLAIMFAVIVGLGAVVMALPNQDKAVHKHIMKPLLVVDSPKPIGQGLYVVVVKQGNLKVPMLTMNRNLTAGKVAQIVRYDLDGSHPAIDLMNFTFLAE